MINDHQSSMVFNDHQSSMVFNDHSILLHMNYYWIILDYNHHLRLNFIQLRNFPTYKFCNWVDTNPGSPTTRREFTTWSVAGLTQSAGWVVTIHVFAHSSVIDSVCTYMEDLSSIIISECWDLFLCCKVVVQEKICCVAVEEATEGVRVDTFRQHRITDINERRLGRLSGKEEGKWGRGRRGVEAMPRCDLWWVRVVLVDGCCWVPCNLASCSLSSSCSILSVLIYLVSSQTQLYSSYCFRPFCTRLSYILHNLDGLCHSSEPPRAGASCAFLREVFCTGFCWIVDNAYESL